MKKVLTGEGYDLPRLSGIMHEMFIKLKGSPRSISDLSLYVDGEIGNNAHTDAWGYIIDADSPYLHLLPDIHLSRLVDIVAGDGWLDVKEGV